MITSTAHHASPQPDKCIAHRRQEQHLRVRQETFGRSWAGLAVVLSRPACRLPGLRMTVSFCLLRLCQTARWCTTLSCTPRRHRATLLLPEPVRTTPFGSRDADNLLTMMLVAQCKTSDAVLILRTQISGAHVACAGCHAGSHPVDGKQVRTQVQPAELHASDLVSWLLHQTVAGKSCRSSAKHSRGRT